MDWLVLVEPCSVLVSLILGQHFWLTLGSLLLKTYKIMTFAYSYNDTYSIVSTNCPIGLVHPKILHPSQDGWSQPLASVSVPLPYRWLASIQRSLDYACQQDDGSREQCDGILIGT
jgi:hypothetical protein